MFWTFAVLGLLAFGGLVLSSVLFLLVVASKRSDLLIEGMLCNSIGERDCTLGELGVERDVETQRPAAAKPVVPEASSSPTGVFTFESFSH